MAGKGQGIVGVEGQLAPIEPLSRGMRSTNFHTRRLAVFIGAVLSSLVLLFTAASHSSALTIGLMSGDNSWVEESGWDGIQHSGAKVFRGAISAKQWENSAEWAKVEQMFAFAAERDIKILPYLYGRPSGSQQFYAQAEWNAGLAKKWEEFVQNVVWEFGYNGWFWTTERPDLPYKPVTAWEVWNEPNLKVNNPNEIVQPEEYANFLQRTSKVLKGAQENTAPGYGIEVLFGGLYSGGGMSVEKFLAEAHHVSGTGLYFNGLSLHPYSFQGGSWGVEQYVNDARNQLNKNEWSGKSLWITELGWNVVPWSGENQPAVYEDQQEEYLEQSFNWIKSVASAKNIPMLIWYIYRDNPCLNDWDAHSGLVRGNGTYRPAWDAFQAETGATPWHGDPNAKWRSEDLCGISTSDPDIASSGVSLDVFARGSDSYLWHRYWNGNSSSEWEGWASLGGSTAASGPGAVYQVGGQTDVMANLSNGSLSHWFYYGPGTSWYSGENLSGNDTSDPDLVSWGTNRLDVFVRGSDYALWHRYWNGSTWSGWESLKKLGTTECGLLWSGPGAASWGSGRIDVVARGENDVLVHWWYDGSWHCAKEGTLEATSGPDLASTGTGQLDMVIERSDEDLWRRHYSTGYGWGGWEDIDGPITSAPAVASFGKKGRLDVVARGSDYQHIRHWWWVGGSLPKPTTEAATSVTETSATLNGKVNPEGTATSYWFEYDKIEYKEGEGPHGTKIPITPESVGSGSSAVAVSRTPTGLNVSTTYHFRVVAEGGGATVTGEDKTFKTETPPPPNTTITGGSSGKVTPDVSFAFSSTEGSSFECALDAGSYASCTTPKTYEGLSEGSHTFKVRAVGAGGADPTPAERTVTVVETAKAVSGIAVLDDFERKELPIKNGKWTKTIWGSEIGSSWEEQWHGYGAWGSHLAGAYWNSATFSDSSGAALVAATLGTGPVSKVASAEYLALLLDMPNPGSEKLGYEARFTGTDGTESGYKVQLSKWVGGTRTILSTKEGITLPVDTTFVLTETGGRLTIWTGTTSFSRVLTAYDTTYSSGYAGILANKGEGTAYNFRAGVVQ